MKLILRCILILLPTVTLAQTNSNVAIKIGGSPVAGKTIIRLGTKADSISFSHNYFEFNNLVSDRNIAKINIKYSGNESGRKEDIFYVYLAAGHIDIYISPIDSNFEFKPTGSTLTVDYQEKLLGPVNHFNSLVNNINKRLLVEKKEPNPDTSLIKELDIQLAAAVKECFAIPQAYIRAYPDSPLSLTALGMLGNGTKGTPITVADLNRLYNSLTEKIKNSVEGVKYQQKLAHLNSQ